MTAPVLPPMFKVRHPMPGEPIEAVITHAGREVSAAHGDDYWLRVAGEIIAAVCRNRAAARHASEINDMRRNAAGPDMARKR